MDFGKFMKNAAAVALLKEENEIQLKDLKAMGESLQKQRTQLQETEKILEKKHELLKEVEAMYNIKMDAINKRADLLNLAYEAVDWSLFGELKAMYTSKLSDDVSGDVDAEQVASQQQLTTKITQLETVTRMAAQFAETIEAQQAAATEGSSSNPQCRQDMTDQARPAAAEQPTACQPLSCSFPSSSSSRSTNSAPAPRANSHSISSCTAASSEPVASSLCTVASSGIVSTTSGIAAPLTPSSTSPIASSTSTTSSSVLVATTSCLPVASSSIAASTGSGSTTGSITPTIELLPQSTVDILLREMNLSSTFDDICVGVEKTTAVSSTMEKTNAVSSTTLKPEVSVKEEERNDSQICVRKAKKCRVNLKKVNINVYPAIEEDRVSAHCIDNLLKSEDEKSKAGARYPPGKKHRKRRVLEDISVNVVKKMKKADNSVKKIQHNQSKAKNLVLTQRGRLTRKVPKVVATKDTELEKLNKIDLTLCPNCDEYFDIDTKYRNHCAKPHPHHCPYRGCKMRFRLIINLLRHLKQTHKDPEASKKLCECKTCGEQIDIKSWHHHLRSTHSQGCPKCPKVCSNKQALLQHYAIVHLDCD